MCDFYEDEQKHVQIVRQLIWEHFHIKLESATIPDTRFTTDGHASVGFYVYLNTEGKNEFGSTADPSVRSIVNGHYHVRYMAKGHPGSRFPCLHMYYFGKNCGFLWPVSA